MSKKIEDINVVDAEVLDFTYPLLKVNTIEIYINGKLQENYQSIKQVALSYVDNGSKIKLLIKE